MKFSLNLVIQLLAFLAQALAQTLELLPPQAKFWALVALSAVQGVTAVLAHFANPDGTPAARPWLK